MRNFIYLTLCTVFFLLLYNKSIGQYNVIKIDGLGALTNQIFRPSFERTFKNFSALISYESGLYENATNKNGDEFYKINGWGIIPEIRYYPAHSNKIPPFGFFIGSYFTHKYISEWYHDNGYEFTTIGREWNWGICTGYKYGGKKISVEIMYGAGVAGGSFDLPNHREVIDPLYKADDLNALYRSMRAEVSVGFVFPKQNFIKTITSPPSLIQDNTSIAQQTDDNSSLSKIIFYHPAKTFGLDYSYDVYINDSIVYYAEWGSADTIQVEALKEITIWAKNGSKELIHFTPEVGKTYFIKCALQKGAVIMLRPSFEFIEPIIAEKEIKKIK